MADYSTIKGFTVQTLATDPSAPGVAGAAWSSGGNLLTAVAYNSGAGTLTAGLSISGATPSGTVKTQEYDGSTWTEGGDVSAYRNDAGSAGSQTSALFFGGSGSPSPVATTEEYDGTSWTAGGSLSRGAARVLQGSNGATQTAAWVAGGRGSPDFNDLMETYDGTSWTETNDLNTSRAGAGAAGTTTAAVLFGGMTGDPSLTGNTDVTEEWDGTSWATSPATLNTTRREMGASGTQTLALCFGGVGPPSNEKKVVTEAFDGSSWTEVADMATARLAGAASKIGTQTASFYAGGEAVTNATEEFTSGSSIAQEGQVWYNDASDVLKGFGKQGTGAWASGGAAPKGAPGTVGFGTQTAAVMASGGSGHPTVTPGTQSATSLYNGSTWSAGNNLNEARQYGASSGTQTAGLIFAGSGGVPNPGTIVGSEEFDGTSWTEGGDLNAPANQAGGIGTQTAAIRATGTVSPPTAVEEYDGTSWTEINNVNTFRHTAKGGGTTAAGIVGPGGPGTVDACEEYDGTSWSEVSNVNTARSGYGASKTPASTFLIFAGTPSTTITEQYDGTSWTEVADCATGTQELAGAGTGVAALKFGGNNPSGYTATSEEWTFADAIKTFTAS